MISRFARWTADRSERAVPDVPDVPDVRDAPASASVRRPASGRSWRRPVLVVVALVVLALIPTFVLRVYSIPSGSMEETLHGCPGCTNDRVLVDKLAYQFGEPAAGDVVVFILPDSWTSSELQLPTGGENPLVEGVAQLGNIFGITTPGGTEFVKRVIATGGQTVQCCDERNRIVVDGVGVDEPYIHFAPEAGRPEQTAFGPVRVPRNAVWVMGDSRNSSVDSRATGNGPVPVGNVIGRVRLVLWPFDRFGGIAVPG